MDKHVCFYKLKDIPEFQSEPMAIAFTSYVLMDNYGFEKAMSKTLFKAVFIPFGAMEIRYVTYFDAPDTGESSEFYIVFDKNGFPAAMVRRDFANGELSESSLGFIQYYLRKFNLEGVLDLIRGLPELDREKPQIH